LATDPYAQGLDVVDITSGSPSSPKEPIDHSHILARVHGSSDDFQYQLPASPKYFVGRTGALKDLADSLGKGQRVFVLNAQSGWGKSSLALKFADMFEQDGGLAFVMDTRTATTSTYVLESLKMAITKAEEQGFLHVPQHASWASIPSALRTIEQSAWVDDSRRILLFFDQFENVFRSPELTRAFRDLALAINESDLPLCVGHAWKTDLVGWTEGHPYQLRDEIRSLATVVTIEPFGSKEVTTLLNRLEKSAGQKIHRDLKDRLREYSQGLPWLLKKLGDHVLREIQRGSTSEALIAEALNVETLFRNDLAELDPRQIEILRHVARYAPLSASEVTERFNPESVQSLVDRRLIVQVGDRLDTYWDTFRDYLNTGTVPVEDSYILRVTPGSAARIMPRVMQHGGRASVQELTSEMETSPTVVFNLTRDLRLLGAITHEPQWVQITGDILEASDPEDVLRAQVSKSLRRHRALALFAGLAERAASDGLSAPEFAEGLPQAFPAVSVAPATWRTYANTFLNWFQYAGLASKRSNRWLFAGDRPFVTTQRILGTRPAVNVRSGIPMETVGRALRFMHSYFADATDVRVTGIAEADRRGLRPLLAIGALSVSGELVRLAHPPVIDADGRWVADRLHALLNGVPGGGDGLKFLASHPDASPSETGQYLKNSLGADWTESTMHSVGTQFRAWARAAGVPVVHPSRIPDVGQEGPDLFDA
jgi:hypothetical protein